MFIGAVTMMVVTSPKLSAYVLVAIPVIILPLYAAGRAVRERSRAAQDTLAEATAFATESLSAVRVMQAFLAEAASVARFRKAALGAYEAARATTLVAFDRHDRGDLPVLRQRRRSCSGSARRTCWRAAMTGGALSQFLLFAVLAAGALGELSQVWSEVSAAAGAAGRIAEILAIAPKIKAPLHPAALPTPPRGEIAFDHVAFAYPGRPGDPVLKSLSLASRQAKSSPSSALPAPASRRSSNCCCASTIRPAAPFRSMESTSPRPIRPICARASRWSRRTR